MKRQCKGTTKKGGPCGTNPLTAATAAKRGLPEEDQDWCNAHHPDLADSDRFGSHAQAREAGKLGGRPPMPKPADVARRLIEDNVIAVLRPHFLTLGYAIESGPDGPVLKQLAGGATMYGESKDGEIVASAYEDLGAQMAAAEKLLDRIYGRPKQQTEITGENGGPVEMVNVAREPEHAGRVAEILQGIRATP